MAITGFDPSRNFAIADLASGIASGATSATLVSGKGALYPDPAADGAFNAVLYNSTDYTSPWEDPDAEIVRVTARSTDTLSTIVRAQEGTADVNHNTGGKTYTLYMALTRKPYDDIIAALIAPPAATVPNEISSDISNFGINCGFTDTLQAIPTAVSSQLALYRGAFAPTCLRYIGTVAQDGLAVSTVWASATNAGGQIVLGGFVYWLMRDASNNYRLYRCDITTDIKTGGNWAQITLAGANLATTNIKFLIGYGNSQFWFRDQTNTTLINASLSGTTLTEVSTITVTGMDYTDAGASVNKTGIWAGFSSAPRLRFASYTGSLTTNKTVCQTASVGVLSYESDTYLALSTTGYTSGSARPFVKIQA